MLLSPRYRFLFVHIAKTGGTSTRAALERVRRRDPYYWLMWPCHRFSHLTGHRLGTKFPRHAKAIAAKEMLPREFYDSLFKFAFVRNPWDRLVSWYVYILREPGHHRHARVKQAGSFGAFVRSELARPRRSQWWMLEGRDGELGVDFVGRFERLEQDMATVCARIGVPYQPLPRANVSAREPYQGYYTPGLAALVRKHWAREIEAFGYTFD